MEIFQLKDTRLIYSLVLLVKESGYKDFISFIQEKWSVVEKIIKDFQQIEEEADLYFDYDASTKFLTKNKLSLVL